MDLAAKTWSKNGIFVPFTTPRSHSPQTPGLKRQDFFSDVSPTLLEFSKRNGDEKALNMD